MQLQPDRSGGDPGAVPPRSYGYDRRRFGRIRVLTIADSKPVTKYRFLQSPLLRPEGALEVTDKLPFRLLGRRNRCLVSRISHIFESLWISAIAISPRSNRRIRECYNLFSPSCWGGEGLEQTFVTAVLPDLNWVFDRSLV